MKNADYYCDKTVFAIEKDESGQKVVHFYGYGYLSDNPVNPYRFVEYTFAIADLATVLIKGFVETENELAEYVTQYVGECSAEELVAIYNNYHERSGKTPIPLVEVSELTPEMDYGLYLYIGDYFDEKDDYAAEARFEGFD